MPCPSHFATIQPKEMPLFFSCRWRSPSGKTGCRAQLAKDSFRPQRAEIAGGGSLAQVSWRAGFLAASAVRSPELITWCGITEHRLTHCPIISGREKTRQTNHGAVTIVVLAAPRVALLFQGKRVLCHANRNAHNLSLCRSRILIKRTTAIRLWLMTFLLPPLSSSAPDPALPY